MIPEINEQESSFSVPIHSTHLIFIANTIGYNHWVYYSSVIIIVIGFIYFGKGDKF